MRRLNNPSGVVKFEASLDAVGSSIVDLNDAMKLSARDLIYRQQAAGEMGRAGKLRGRRAAEALRALDLYDETRDWEWTQCITKYCFRDAVKGTGILDGQMCKRCRKTAQKKRPVVIKPRTTSDKKSGRTKAA